MDIELWVPPHISDDDVVKCVNDWLAKYPDTPPYARFVQDYVSSAWPMLWHLKTKMDVNIVERCATVPEPRDPADEEAICAICHNRLAGGEETLVCQHTFHTMCIHRWLGRANTCPVCRTKV